MYIITKLYIPNNYHYTVKYIGEKMPDRTHGAPIYDIARKISDNEISKVYIVPQKDCIPYRLENLDAFVDRHYHPKREDPTELEAECDRRLYEVPKNLDCISKDHKFVRPHPIDEDSVVTGDIVGYFFWTGFDSKQSRMVSLISGDHNWIRLTMEQFDVLGRPREIYIDKQTIQKLDLYQLKEE